MVLNNIDYLMDVGMTTAEAIRFIAYANAVGHDLPHGGSWIPVKCLGCKYYSHCTGDGLFWFCSVWKASV